MTNTTFFHVNPSRKRLLVRSAVCSAPEDPDEGRLEKFHFFILFLILGSVVLFSLLLTTFGLMISLAAMIVVATLASKHLYWKETLIMIVVLDALAYAIFVVGIGLFVPVWPSFL